MTRRTSRPPPARQRGGGCAMWNDTGDVGHACLPASSRSASPSRPSDLLRSGQRPQISRLVNIHKSARPPARVQANAWPGVKPASPPAPAPPAVNRYKAPTPQPPPRSGAAAATTTGPTEIQWRRNSVPNRPSVRPSIRPLQEEGSHFNPPPPSVPPPLPPQAPVGLLGGRGPYKTEGTNATWLDSFPARK